MNNPDIFLIFGDNLFPSEYFDKFKHLPFLMIEGPDLQVHFNYHKIRLAFLQSASRHKFYELKESGFNVSRINLSDMAIELGFCDRLKKYIIDHHVKVIHSYGKEDKFFHEKLVKLFLELGIEYKTYKSPLFINTHEQFSDYLDQYKKPFMKTFYELSRKKFNVLVDKNLAPLGGKWSFDEDNREKISSKVVVPSIQKPKVDKITLEVILEINNLYSNHPGELNNDGSNFYLPVTRQEALLWLEEFFINRFNLFGKYEDAISIGHDFNFHSVLSPLINVGLLTPQEVINKALLYAKENKVPLNSLEGFIRQILGWREFIRGIHYKFSNIQNEKNFFNHERKLTQSWYSGETGIDPLDFAIKKVQRLGYLHHIERLMIVSNIMLLCEIHPHEVHRWFNEMFVDSMDWVMGPNVFGMGQFSDGGIFATKPYFSGSNYILKMSDFKKGDWSVEMDSLFWSFIYKNRDFFKNNYRLSMMVRTVEKMDEQKLIGHLDLGELVRRRITE